MYLKPPRPPRYDTKLINTGEVLSTPLSFLLFLLVFPFFFHQPPFFTLLNLIKSGVLFPWTWVIPLKHLESGPEKRH